MRAGTESRSRSDRTRLTGVVGAALAALGVWLMADQLLASGSDAAPARFDPSPSCRSHNLSGDPEQEYFADGMTEQLIADLAKAGGLRVIARTSVMHYKDARKPVPAIARELKVDAIIEGPSFARTTRYESPPN